MKLINIVESYDTIYSPPSCAVDDSYSLADKIDFKIVDDIYFRIAPDAICKIVDDIHYEAA